MYVLHNDNNPYLWFYLLQLLKDKPSLELLKKLQQCATNIIWAFVHQKSLRNKAGQNLGKSNESFTIGIAEEKVGIVLRKSHSWRCCWRRGRWWRNRQRRSHAWSCCWRRGRWWRNCWRKSNSEGVVEGEAVDKVRSCESLSLRRPFGSMKD